MKKNIDSNGIQIDCTSGSHPLANGQPGRYSPSSLTPVTLYGVIIPWAKAMADGCHSDFKLVGTSGNEYFLVADQEWREVLTQYLWEDVKLQGLLNIANMAIIPQIVCPKGSRGDRGNLVDLADWKSKNLTKLAKKVAELVLVPVAVLAMMT